MVYSGEKDLIEGVHTSEGDGNTYVTHTSDECRMTKGRDTQWEFLEPFLATALGVADTSICKDDNSHPDHVQCTIQSTNSLSFGKDFNQKGGGVFVTQFEGRNIRSWFFSRDQIPADITSGKPKPKRWGIPAAHFETMCAMSELFSKQRIIINTNFCGDVSISLHSLAYVLYLFPVSFSMISGADEVTVGR